MISYLSGTIIDKEDNLITLNVHGVGYGVLASDHTVAAATIGSDAEYYIYTHVREQEMTLYAFAQKQERAMFLLLTSVSGIGPKAALNILSIADVAAISAAISNKDTTILTNVSGIGKKTAEKVIVELQGRIDDFSSEDSATALRDSSAVDALKSMGYSIGEARDALSHVSKDVSDVSERIKLALKSLGR